MGSQFKEVTRKSTVKVGKAVRKLLSALIRVSRDPSWYKEGRHPYKWSLLLGFQSFSPNLFLKINQPKIIFMPKKYIGMINSVPL